LSSTTERNIQVELYRNFQNLIVKKFTSNDIEFVGVDFEPVINGRPDLVIKAVDKGKNIPLLVIETKRKVPFVDRKFDPYSKDVIRQASRYALELGAPYFATCNGEFLVLFDTFTAGVPLPQRRLKHFKVAFDENFAALILNEISQLRKGLGKWLELDDIFVQRLRTFHSFLTPYFLDSLKIKLNDSKFRAEYKEWLNSQFLEYNSENNEKVAEQLAYLLMNKLTFYKTLELQIPTLNKINKIETEDPKKFQLILNEYFEKITKNIDYEAIFQPHFIFDQIPFSPKSLFILNDFIEELSTYDLTKIRSDIIGRVYEELIPPTEKHRLGQYYTPPPIVELISEFCIRSSKDNVLDPACGSGGFLIKSYHKLKDLKKKENIFLAEEILHKEVLDQLYGVDINPFPAQLTSINLAIRNLKTISKNLKVIINDFFKVDPLIDIINKFDVIITNPPYTDWREMDNKDIIRNVALNYNDKFIEMGKQAGIYAYFFTHATKFLREKGMMGQIVSDAWLDMKYGIGLKQFFLDHFKILAIIAFDKGVFDIPLVNTVIVILEKCEQNELERFQNNVRFCRIKRSMDIAKLLQVINTSKYTDDENIRLIQIKQSSLIANRFWGVYLRAPTLYFKINELSRLTELQNIAKSRIGLQTYADKFYILNKDQQKIWGIENKYLVPIITSPKLVKGLKIDADKIKEYVISCSDEKESINESYIIKYIEWGESLEVKIRKKLTSVIGFNNLPKIQSTKRNPWYNLTNEIRAKNSMPILYPYMTWDNLKFIWNEVGILDHQNFIGIRPNKIDDMIPLLAILNSSLTEFIVRCVSHVYGGGVAKITPGDIKKIKVLNIDKLKKSDKDIISKLYLNYLNETSDSKNELDKCVFDLANINNNERNIILKTIDELKSKQKIRKDVDVLIITNEKWSSAKKYKEKKLKKSASKRLDLWIKPD
jgi:type I restriction-modification system DNA methylase subunit/6-pyruvoyl-tetrahydropterin synthase